MRIRPRSLVLLLVLAASAWGAEAPGAPEPVAQGTTWAVVGGSNQAVAPGVPFALIAQLSGPGPLDGVEVGLLRVLSGGPSVTCDTASTNVQGFVTVTCVTGFWTIETQVRITLEDEFERILPDFTVTVRPPFIAEGLTIIGAERFTVARGQPFDLLVQAARFGQPLEDLRLTVTRDPSAVPLSCPPVVFTDSLGQARITCSSLDILQENAVVLITVSDGQGSSVTFTATLLAIDRLVDGLFKLSGDNQAVPQGTPFPRPLVVQLIIDGRPASGVELTVEVSDPSVVLCPTEVETGSDGAAFIQCASGFIQDAGIATNATASIEVEERERRFLIDPFRVSVVRDNLNTISRFELLSDSQISVLAGNTIENAVVVETRGFDGSLVSGAPVYFSSNRNIEFDPEVALSGVDGRASTDATFGCPGGTGFINVGSRPGSIELRVPVNVRIGGDRKLTKLQGDGQAGTPGERLDRLALVAQLTDVCLAPLTRELVQWRVLPQEAATLERVLSTTDGDGKSSVIVRLGSRPGPFQVIAKHLDQEAVFNIAVVAEPGQAAAIGGTRVTIPRGGAAPLGVRLISPEGFPVPLRTVFFEITSGGGELSAQAAITDENGEATTEYVAPGGFGRAQVLASVPPRAPLGEEGAGPVFQGPLDIVFDITIGGRRPVINPDGFVNGASFRPGWVPGSLATIFGQGLLEDVNRPISVQGPPFQTQVAGFSVTVNGVPAPLISLIDQGPFEQINFQTPFQIQPGPATVVVSNNGTERTFTDVAVNRVMPGVFQLEGGFAAALHADFRLVQPNDPARPGEVILLFLTGLGATNPPVPTNAAGPVPAASTLVEPVVGLNNQGVESFGGFYAPGLATVYQVNFRVPADAESGDHNLTVVADGAGSQTVLLPVRR